MTQQLIVFQIDIQSSVVKQSAFQIDSQILIVKQKYFERIFDSTLNCISNWFSKLFCNWIFSAIIYTTFNCISKFQIGSQILIIN